MEQLWNLDTSKITWIEHSVFNKKHLLFTPAGTGYFRNIMTNMGERKPFRKYVIIHRTCTFNLEKDTSILYK